MLVPMAVASSTEMLLVPLLLLLRLLRLARHLPLVPHLTRAPNLPQPLSHRHQRRPVHLRLLHLPQPRRRLEQLRRLTDNVCASSSHAESVLLTCLHRWWDRLDRTDGVCEWKHLHREQRLCVSNSSAISRDTEYAWHLRRLLPMYVYDCGGDDSEMNSAD